MTSRNGTAVATAIGQMSAQREGRGLAQPAEVARQHEHQRELEELRRLDADHAEREPALGAHADHADDVDGDQRREAEAVDDPREVQDDVVVDDGRQQQRREPDAEPPQVVVEQRRHPLGAVGGAVDPDRADRRERQRQSRA